MLGLGIENPKINTNGIGKGISRFISTWKTDNAGTSNNDQISIPTEATGTYSCTIYWGDGTSDTITAWNDAAWTHTYAGGAGTYRVIIDGIFNGFRFNAGGDCLKLLTIDNWGADFKLGDSNSQFYGCANLQINAVDTLNTNGMTSFYRTFYECTTLNATIVFSDTSGITNMTYMFYGCTSFNGEVTFLNTINATDLVGLFYGCTVFNQSVSHFNTSKATNMYAMFRACPAFNQSVSNFNTALVTNMSNMFRGCTNFNKSVSSFNTANVNTMAYMFFECTNFNQAVNHFDTSKVTTMYGMFYGAAAFDQAVNSWDTALVTTIKYMFYGATVFNQDVSTWDVGLVTDMDLTFRSASAFNQDLSSWDIANVTTMTDMLLGASLWSTANYDAALIAWDALAVQSGVPFRCESFYTSGGAAEAARTSLVVGDSWTITDLGGV